LAQRTARSIGSASGGKDSSLPAALANAQRLRAKATERLATAQIEMLDLENRSYEPRMRLLSAQSRDRQRSVDELGQHVVALETLALARTGADASSLCTRVATERGAIELRARLLTDAADTNVAECEQLTRAIQRIGDLHAQQQKLDATRQDTVQALTNTEERVRIGGVTEACRPDPAGRAAQAAPAVATCAANSARCRRSWPRRASSWSICANSRMP